MLTLITVGGLGVSLLLTFGTGAGKVKESSSLNFCMGHTTNFEVSLALMKDNF